MFAQYSLELTMVLKCGLGLHQDEVVGEAGLDSLVLFGKVGCSELLPAKIGPQRQGVNTDANHSSGHLRCRSDLGFARHPDQALDLAFLLRYLP